MVIVERSSSTSQGRSAPPACSPSSPRARRSSQLGPSGVVPASGPSGSTSVTTSRRDAQRSGAGPVEWDAQRSGAGPVEWDAQRSGATVADSAESTTRSVAPEWSRM